MKKLRTRAGKRKSGQADPGDFGSPFENAPHLLGDTVDLFGSNPVLPDDNHLWEAMFESERRLAEFALEFADPLAGLVLEDPLAGLVLEDPLLADFRAPTFFACLA